jgi:hypothetical protein
MRELTVSLKKASFAACAASGTLIFADRPPMQGIPGTATCVLAVPMPPRPLTPT